MDKIQHIIRDRDTTLTDICEKLNEVIDRVNKSEIESSAKAMLKVV